MKNFLIFDSECLMCQSFLIFLDKIYKDKESKLFIASNPKKITKLLEYNQLNFLKNRFNTLEKISKKTIIYIKGDLIFIEFKAIMNLLIDSSNSFFRITALFLDVLVPKFVGDFLYKLFAKNRILISNLLFKKQCNLFFRNLKIIE